MKSLKKHITKYKSQLWRHNNFPQFLKVINIQISASFFFFFFNEIACDFHSIKTLYNFESLIDIYLSKNKNTKFITAV